MQDGSNGFDSTRRRESGQQAARAFVLDKLFDREPPHSPQAEMSVLGSMILDPSVTAEVLQHIRSGEAFYSQRNGLIFDSLSKLYGGRNSGDLVQLVELLERQGALDDAGGQEYLVELFESVPSSANAEHYARIVAEKHRLRRLIDAAGQTLYDCFHMGEKGADEASELLDEAEQRIFAISDSMATGEAASLASLLTEAMEQLEAMEGRSVTGVATGYYDLDEMTSGLQPGELIIVAARPSMGKTALALNMAEQIAMGAGPEGERTPVGVFSLEMSKQSVAQRMMCARSGVDSHLVRTNRLGDAQFQQLLRACGELEESPIFIDDTPSLSVLQLRARARRMKHRFGIGCILIDYLQLLTAPGSSRESRQVEVSAISRGVKALARELSVPVVCLSQLNRGAEQREGHRPRMSDLRESGSIEQDADVICLLHREEYYHQGDDEWLQMNEDKVGLAELIIAKQRNGPTGVAKMTWDAKTTRFKNHAGYHGEAAAMTAGSYGAAMSDGASSGGGWGAPAGGSADVGWGNVAADDGGGAGEEPPF